MYLHICWMNFVTIHNFMQSHKIVEKNDRKLWNDRKSWLWCHKIVTLMTQNCGDILKRLREYFWFNDFAQFSDFLLFCDVFATKLCRQMYRCYEIERTSKEVHTLTLFSLKILNPGVWSSFCNMRSVWHQCECVSDKEMWFLLTHKLYLGR